MRKEPFKNSGLNRRFVLRLFGFHHATPPAVGVEVDPVPTSIVQRPCVVRTWFREEGPFGRNPNGACCFPAAVHSSAKSGARGRRARGLFISFVTALEAIRGTRQYEIDPACAFRDATSGEQYGQETRLATWGWLAEARKADPFVQVLA